MWAIIESTVNYTTADVFKMYAVIAATALIVVVFMFKTACSEDD
ncbi:MAG: hypothetical protein Q9M11_06510 [Mariprofundaceae bacterium]|nr:hypothetical protein [Mariprofundaceae bacterium]